MNNKRVYVDIHVIQTVPPSCVNRDDTGAPKSAIYGGTRRARISSQCWKHAVRVYFRDLLDRSSLALRTKTADKAVAKVLTDSGMEEDAAHKKAEEAMLALQVKSSKDGKKDPLFFLSNAQVNAVAEIIMQNPDIDLEAKPKKEAGTKSEKDTEAEQKKKAYLGQLKEAITHAPGIEIALFGRMAASDSTLNMDASCQVAHAISTHKVMNEFDYYTAVDDMKANDKEASDQGAGFLSTAEFNSATLYRYATIAAHDLAKNLGDDTASAICAFTEAFVKSMPTGKENAYANHTLPDAVLVTVRTDQPINFVGAFEDAVETENGYVKASEERLVQYAEKTYDDFAGAPAVSYVVGGLDGVGDKMSFNEMLKELEHTVTEQLCEI